MENGNIVIAEFNRTFTPALKHPKMQGYNPWLFSSLYLHKCLILSSSSRYFFLLNSAITMLPFSINIYCCVLFSPLLCCAFTFLGSNPVKRVFSLNYDCRMAVACSSRKTFLIEVAVQLTCSSLFLTFLHFLIYSWIVFRMLLLYLLLKKFPSFVIVMFLLYNWKHACLITLC
jgi:hypothetical protein